MRIPSLAVLATALALTGAARAADYTPPAENPQAAHAESDKNKDGQLDREEFHQRMVDIFYTADADKNGSLDATEFATLDTKTTFASMDKNGDGKLTMTEFVAYRFAQFNEADEDENGTLSVEEVIEYVK